MERLSKSKIARYATLKHRKGRKKEKLFIVQGVKAVRDTLPHFDLEILMVRDELETPPGVNKGKIFLVSELEMKKISTLNDVPEIIAVFRIPQTHFDIKIDEWNDFILVLDGVSDPGNFGTIIRTSHWFGIRKIFCSIECPDLYNPKVVQSSMGSIAQIEIIYCDLDNLFSANPKVPVYGLLLDGEDIFRPRNLPPGFIVMGNEGHGISKDIIRHITTPLTIPPSQPDNHPDSLNVAVATAITIAQLKQ